MISKTENKAFQNPFSINRAEHLGADLYRFYAGANLLGGLLSGKSLVLQGGRGSGKTMFFMYHSYESKKREHLDPVSNRSRLLEMEKILGIYFKAGPDLVTGFRRKGQGDVWWLDVFGHYFNVTICHQMCHIAADIKGSELASLKDEVKICAAMSRNFGWDDNNITTFKELAEKLECSEDLVLLYINNIDQKPKPFLSHSSRAMRRFAEMLVNSIGINGLTFHVFVDEFENLEGYQQQLINSLVKNPDKNLVFDVGVRKRGFKTLNTLADSEQISAWDDFRPFDLEEEISGSGYDRLIREICTKRLRTVSELISCPADDSRLKIESYLGFYDIRKEVDLIVSGQRTPPYLKDIEAQLDRISDVEKKEELLEALTKTDPMFSRLSLVLLLQGKKPDQVLAELKKYKGGHDSKFKEWLHNYGLGVVFLLCRDYRQRKRYFGYDAYLQLSSGIPRYFIQLCFYAFDYANKDDSFVFSAEDKISIQVQDKAAYHLSVNKVDEIDTYPPVGHKLKRLVLVLGRVFEQLHKRPTISEPERNHFYTNYDAISASSRETLNSGIMWAVFQPRPLTKIKSVKQPRGIEYHLNHIYAPYFEISYRRKRRLDIPVDDFNSLVDGDDSSVAAAAQKLGQVKVGSLSDLLQWQDMQPYQMDLWSSDEGQ
ncbi:MAG: hypothetical protein ACLQGU_07235 [bacterium]